jgi:hypothetical protein
MPKQQRAVRIEQKSQLAAMQTLETRSDEELASETRYRAAAQAILGARAAERYDADAAREHFQKALAAARPQERLQLRRMADASLALAERRAGDLKAATAKLGVEAPTSRQLLRGILVAIGAVIAILALGFGIVELISLPFGGISLDLAIFYGVALVLVVLVGLIFFVRRRGKDAMAKRREALAARSGR